MSGRLLIAALALAGCRDYVHFEKNDPDASVLVDLAEPDASDASTDGAMTVDVCAEPAPSDLGASPDVPIGHETTLTSPTRSPGVTLVTFKGFADESLVGISGSGDTLLRIDHPLSPNPQLTTAQVVNHADVFVAIPVVGDDVHIIVGTRSNATSGILSEYRWSGMVLDLLKSTTTAYAPLVLSSGDINADGHDDLLIGESDTANPAVIYYPHQSQSNFLDQGPRPQPTDLLPNAVTAFTLPGGLTVLAALQTGNASKLDLFERGSPGDSFSSPNQQGTLPPSIYSMTTADVDGDGLTDLVFGGDEQLGLTSAPTSELVAWTFLGTPTPGTFSIPVNAPTTGLQHIDWNHDGADDLFVWEMPTGGQVLVPAILQNRGGKRFTELTWPGLPQAPTSEGYTMIASPAVQACPARLVFSDPSQANISTLAP